MKLFKFRVKSFLFFRIFLFIFSNSLFFIDSFISIILYIEISVIDFLLNLYLFFVNLNLINYNRRLNYRG